MSTADRTARVRLHASLFGRSGRSPRFAWTSWQRRMVAPTPPFDESALGCGQHTPPISPQWHNREFVDQQTNHRLERNATRRPVSLTHRKRVVERLGVGVRQGDRPPARMPMNRDNFAPFAGQDVVRIGAGMHAPADSVDPNDGCSECSGPSPRLRPKRAASSANAARTMVGASISNTIMIATIGGRLSICKPDASLAGSRGSIAVGRTPGSIRRSNAR